jgi:hypothetical protein
MSLKTLNQFSDSSSFATRIPMLPPQHSLTIIHYFAHGKVISQPLAHPFSSSFKPLIILVPKKQKDRKTKGKNMQQNL